MPATRPPDHPRPCRKGGADHRRIDRHRRGPGPGALLRRALRWASTTTRASTRPRRWSKTITDAGGTAVLIQGDVSDSQTGPAHRRRGGERPRRPRWPHQQRRADARSRALRRNERRALRRGHGPERTLGVRSVAGGDSASQEDSGGFIINTTSIAARNGGGGGALLYAAAKGFVSTLTRGLAKELIGSRASASMRWRPGVIDTPFHERYSSAEQMRAMLATIPQGRVGTVEDCVGAYLFLASQRSVRLHHRPGDRGERRAVDALSRRQLAEDLAPGARLADFFFAAAR